MQVLPTLLYMLLELHGVSSCYALVNQDTTEAFYFQYVVRETHYRELIRYGDSLTAAGADSIMPAFAGFVRRR